MSDHIVNQKDTEQLINRDEIFASIHDQYGDATKLVEAGRFCFPFKNHTRATGEPGISQCTFQ